MSDRTLRVAFAAARAERLAGFWAGLLRRDVVAEASSWLVPGDETQLGLRYVESGVEPAKLNDMHLHLTSHDLEQQRSTVAMALALGAAHLDVGQRDDEEHVVLADPEGNAFCVIEPGNSFLAGCGFLGEVACDGSREVGRFWSEALGWPLVWDQDGETAIQSPQGGTKVAWGGPSGAAVRVPDRQRLELSTHGDVAEEVARLVALGATALGGGEDGVVRLADPDGAEFLLRG